MMPVELGGITPHRQHRGLLLWMIVFTVAFSTVLTQSTHRQNIGHQQPPPRVRPYDSRAPGHQFSSFNIDAEVEAQHRLASTIQRGVYPHGGSAPSVPIESGYANGAQNSEAHAFQHGSPASFEGGVGKSYAVQYFPGNGVPFGREHHQPGVFTNGGGSYSVRPGAGHGSLAQNNVKAFQQELTQSLQGGTGNSYAVQQLHGNGGVAVGSEDHPQVDGQPLHRGQIAEAKLLRYTSELPERGHRAELPRRTEEHQDTRHAASSANTVQHTSHRTSEGMHHLNNSAHMPSLHEHSNNLLHVPAYDVANDVLHNSDGESYNRVNMNVYFYEKYALNNNVSGDEGSNEYDNSYFIENHEDEFREVGNVHSSVNSIRQQKMLGDLQIPRLSKNAEGVETVRRTKRSVVEAVQNVSNKTVAARTRAIETPEVVPRNTDDDGIAENESSPELSDANSTFGPEGLNCSGYPGNDDDEPRIHLVTLRWEEVGVYFTITSFIIFAGLGKLAFHQLHWLSSKVPEPCLLIVLGLLMGLIIHFTSHETDPELTCHHHVQFPTFTSEAFFLVLLPPIILESAYSLHDRAFIDNIGSVLIFAVIGTLLNTFIIGPSLYGLAASGAMGNFNITLTESLVFSSLISAVDPVAVLNIFQDLGVNKGLYFLVFGESLLNDGVTVVVYNTLSTFMEMTVVKAKDYVMSVLAFFVVSLCGAIIGLIYGLLTALVTRATTTVRVVEPLALLGLAYLAYLSAELFHLSGIISLIVCGLVQAHYAFQNISSKSYTCVKYFTKMASATSETIIFMFLGMVLVSEEHAWHTGFVLWTLALCLIVRFAITLSLSALTNRYRLHAIGMSEQLILAYGGLRGAVAFSLVTMLPEDMVLKGHFVTATLAVVLFTVFVQGITIRPLVNWLDVSKRNSAPRQLFEEVHANVIDHMMAGIEEVLGDHGDFYLREQLKFYNEKYLKRWLVRPTCEAPLKRLFEKIAITEHYAHLYGPAVLIRQQQEEHQKLVDDDKRPSITGVTTSEIFESNGEGGLALHEALPGVQLPHVQLRGRSTSGDKDTRVTISGPISGAPHQQLTPANSVEADAKILRRAISSNPYNQLHYKYNRNLVNADNQELSDHLQRRREKAKRLTRLASLSSLRQSSLMGPADPSAPSAQYCHHLSMMGASVAGANAAASYDSLIAGVPAPSASSIQRGAAPQQLDSPPVLRRQRTETITMTPEDIAEIRQLEQQRLSGSSHAHHHRNSNNIVLPGEVFSPPHEALTQLPDGMELLEDIRNVNAMIYAHKRRADLRRNTLRLRRARTLSDEASYRTDYHEPHIPPPVFHDISATSVAEADHHHDDHSSDHDHQLPTDLLLTQMEPASSAGSAHNQRRQSPGASSPSGSPLNGDKRQP